MPTKFVPNYISVFDKKIEDLKKKIKKELDKPKKDRNKDALHSLIADTKKLQKKIREVKEYTSLKCPHCGKKIDTKDV